MEFARGVGGGRLDCLCHRAEAVLIDVAAEDARRVVRRLDCDNATGWPNLAGCVERVDADVCANIYERVSRLEAGQNPAQLGLVA
jgi:hypothetical protein